MNIPFCKYHGTGNDFILLDQRSNSYVAPGQQQLIQFICDRRFGVGGDGLILLQDHPDYDFEMIYYNSDGAPSSMCGNGGRCIVSFARKLGIINSKAHFLAVDGPHEANINEEGTVALKMADVKELKKIDDHFELDTGSPHFVAFVEDVDDINVVENGQAIRYSEKFRKEGINVNFVEKTNAGIIVLTYERGVEDETFSCGTGVTAAAIATAFEAEGKKEVKIKTKGGPLKVQFENNTSDGFQNIWLSGPTTLVFEGTMNLSALNAKPDLGNYLS